MPTAERSCRIVINSEARLLHVMRCVVRFRAQEAGVPPCDVDCLTVAIDEAASNIIRHAYGNRPDGKLTLDVKSFPDRIEFVLEDSGPKISPEAWRPRPLDEVRPGGLGTHFIKCFMDVISYDEDFVGGNRLRLVKHISPAGPTNHESSGQDRK
jgi:anti-sigma regulatory factor (Ser/Thr protein kinase)